MAPAIYKAKECPRCGSNVIGFIKTGQGTPQFFAICRHCFRYGETAANRDEALALWNHDPERLAAGMA
jgi:ribosomal protein S14